jgi:hypothetical protein
MRYRECHRRHHKYLASAALVLVAIFKASAGIPDKQTITQGPDKTTQRNAVAPSSQDPDDMEQLRKSVRQLTTEVERLAKRVADLERERWFDVTRVLLVGEEQRAESLQVRLRENFERQIVLQVRLEQVNNQLRPENIERTFLGVGLVRPEEARETVRRRLDIEKQGILAQLELLRQERNRFQSALATSDVAIQRLRLRLSEAGRP